MRGKLRHRAQFRTAAHVLASDLPTPHVRPTRRNLQFRSAHLNLSRSPCCKSARRHVSQWRQSARHNKQTMSLRAVPLNPLQRFVEKPQRTPGNIFRSQRSLPIAHQLLADSAEIPLISLDSAVQISPDASSKSRQPPSHTRTRNFIALQQISQEPPLQRRRGQQRAIQIKKRTSSFSTNIRPSHRIPSIAAARAGSFRSTAPRSR